MHGNSAAGSAVCVLAAIPDPQDNTEDYHDDEDDKFQFFSHAKLHDRILSKPSSVELDDIPSAWRWLGCYPGPLVSGALAYLLLDPSRKVFQDSDSRRFDRGVDRFDKVLERPARPPVFSWPIGGPSSKSTP